jgi:integrase
MGHIRKTPAGNWRACWRDAAGRQRSKTFHTRREASAFLATIEAASHNGAYVDPHAGRRVQFGTYATQWLATRTVEVRTAERDGSLMRNHVLSYWSQAPLARIDHSSVQEWISSLSSTLAPASVAECHRLFSGVLKSAVRDRLISANPAEGVRLPKKRRRAGSQQTISRETFANRLLPAVPMRHRAVVGLAGGTGLRWGECAGLRWESVDLDRGVIQVERVAVEDDHSRVTTKPYPKSRAGRRTVPMPPAVRQLLVRHRERYGEGPHGEVFVNEASTPMRRGLFRARIWRPSLVRAGLLGNVVEDGSIFLASWPTASGATERGRYPTRIQAVQAVAQNASGGLRFHDLRHSYASWLITSGVPVPDVQRVMGHENPTTTLAIYIHVQAGLENRVLDALAAFSLPSEDSEADEGAASDPGEVP